MAAEINKIGLSKTSPLIPLDQGGGILVGVVVAAMAFLACLSLVTIFGATKLVNAWGEGLAGAATVRVSALEPDIDNRVAISLDILKNAEGIESARQLSEDEVAALLRPWFGERPPLKELPTPRIIAVKLDRTAEPTPALIQARLDGAQVNAVYDDHDRWRARAGDAGRAVRSFAIGSLAIVALAMAAVIAFSVQAGLAAHRDVIAALRLAGAEDRFIANVYQRRFFWVALLGGLAGCVLALLLSVAMGAAGRFVNVLPQLDAPSGWAMSALIVTLGAIAVAVGTARFAVISNLRRGA